MVLKNMFSSNTYFIYDGLTQEDYLDLRPVFDDQSYEDSVLQIGTYELIINARPAYYLSELYSYLHSYDEELSLDFEPWRQVQSRATLSVTFDVVEDCLPSFAAAEDNFKDWIDA